MSTRLRILFSIIVALALIPTRVFALTIPNDPDFSRQWHLSTIGAPAAWDYTQGSKDIIVAVLDTGVDMDHPDLADNIWTNTKEIPGNGVDDDGDGFIDDTHGWNFVEQTNDPNPQFNSGWTEAGITHGTVIAGIIGAVGNNLSGATGVNWHVKIMPLRILDSAGIGDSAVAAQAIDYAVKNGARVLNFSFVTNEHNIALDEAIARAARAGVLVVAAAGNNKSVGGDNLDTTPMYPVCGDGVGTNYVLGVAATDQADKKADFSNYGSNCVDISAPGVNLVSTQVYNPSLAAFNSFTRGGWNGTSVASPVITGAAALLLAANPGLSRETLLSTLLNTADPIDATNPNYRGELGSGRVNVERAVKSALGLPVQLPIQQTVTSPTSKLSFVALGASAGVAPEVRVYSIDGLLYSKFMVYSVAFRGGVNVAVGDVDGDGKIEIVTAPGPGGGPDVRVFDLKGNQKYRFNAYAPLFHGGVSIATGDIDGDGKAEIITGAGPGGGAHVRIFAADGTVKKQFFAFDKGVSVGVNVAAGDMDGDGKAEIVAAPASRAGTQPVKYFNSDGAHLGSVTFLTTTASGGVSPVVADVTGDAHGDIILSRTVTSGSVTVVVSGITPRPPFTLAGFAGMWLSSIDMNADGRSDIVAVPASGAVKVRIVNGSGKIITGSGFSAAIVNGAHVAAFTTIKP